MLKPEVQSPWLAQQGFLPTQITLGEGAGTYANIIRSSMPFYDEMVSIISEGRSRPGIPEYQTIADHVMRFTTE